MNRAFAILVPSFNSAATIADTLRSIQRQEVGLDRIRAVVVADDSSADDTVGTARRCWSCTVPLHIRRNHLNLGEYGNVNTAVAAMDPDISWFFILHADDLAKQNWLQVMIRAVEAAPPNIVSITASWDVLNPDGSTSAGERRTEEEKIVVPGGNQTVQRWVMGGCWWKITSSCIRRETFLGFGGLDTTFRQMGDVDFILRVVHAGFDLIYIPMSLSIYRVHDSSVSSNSLRKNYDLQDDFRIFRKFASCLEPNQVSRAYRMKSHAAAHRAVYSLARGELRRTASALRLGLEIWRSYLRAAAHTRILCP